MEPMNPDSRKCQKLSGTSHYTSSFDRLSRLPDEILSHILSFLDTQDSIRTGILSKRWRYVWATVPKLDFESDIYANDMPFSEMVNRVLLLHRAQSIHTFNLNHRNMCRDYQFESWICTLSAKNIQNLTLNMKFQFSLPQCLFTCKSLVDLSLGSCELAPLSAPVHLPSLKKLNLCFVEYGSDGCIEQLLSGCPVLEELDIDMTHLELASGNISSPTLKKLSISYGMQFYKEEYQMGYRVDIDAPALEYLYLNDCFCRSISVETLNSLTEADIHFNVYDVEENYDYTISMLNTIYGVVCNLKRLKLRIRSMERLKLSSRWIGKGIRNSRFSSQAMRLTDLNKLELDAHSLFLTWFLELAENLEVLIVSEAYTKDLKCWRKPKQQPICLSSHLTTIVIDQFRGTKHGFEMIRYLLKNAEVLKKMIVYFDRDFTDVEAKSDARNKISRIKRGSKVCELDFSDAVWGWRRVHSSW